MAVEHENISRLKDAYAAWAHSKGTDCECWMTILSDEATLASLAAGAPEMSFSAPRFKKSEIVHYLQELTSDWDMVSFDMNDFIADGDRVVAIGQVAWRNKATGKIAETPKVDIWRFAEGKVVDLREFYDTARAYAAATPD